MSASGIEPATFWLVAQCLNQLRHRVPSKYIEVLYIILIIWSSAAVAAAANKNAEIDLKFLIVSFYERPETRILFLHVCPSVRMEQLGPH